jgi:hypothetical protein
MGYCYDLGEELANAGVAEHQPVCYGPGGIPGAFPMQPSIQSGVDELTRLMLLRDPNEPWVLICYSEGAIVASTVFDLVRTKGHKLNAYEHSFLGAVAFGNPRREEGHTVPGGIDPGGHGIVTPNLKNTPDSWWDFAAGKHMIGASGQDLYTTCGYGGMHPQEVLDQEAIWEIVRTGSIWKLVLQILKLAIHPIRGPLDAVKAGLSALDFFAVHGLTPHTTYQFIEPIAGDQRDCWRVALDYLFSLGNRPRSAAKFWGVVHSPSTATPQHIKDLFMTTPAPAAVHLDAATLETVAKDLREAVNGLLIGLQFALRFESVVPEKYQHIVAMADTAVKVLTIVDSVLNAVPAGV